MTNTEDELLDMLSRQAKLTLLYQVLSAFTCYPLTVLHTGFWIPASCCLIGAALSLVEINWSLPRLRRRIWETPVGTVRITWRCRRCECPVSEGRCRCAESPSPWEPRP